MMDSFSEVCQLDVPEGTIVRTITLKRNVSRREKCRRIISDASLSQKMEDDGLNRRDIVFSRSLHWFLIIVTLIVKSVAPVCL